MTDLVRSACLTSYPEIARSLGLQPVRLLDACGIDRRCLDDSDIKIPTEGLARLLEASAKAAKVEDFGLRLAETRTLSVLGPIGLLVREEATVRDALHALMRYMRLHNEALHIRLKEHQDGQATIAVEIRADRVAPMRQGAELAVGVLYRLLQSLCGQHWRPLVCFTHDAPRRDDRHRRLFRGRVAFAHDINGIICTTRDLDRTIPSSDPTLARYARQHLEALLARPNATISDKVRELVALQLASGRCTADRVARQIGVDRRTLHRKLTAEGQTFSTIVEAIRLDIVTRALPSRERPLSTLADVLGFSCLSAFSRWFHWRFKTSPTNLRKRMAHRAAAGAE